MIRIAAFSRKQKELVPSAWPPRPGSNEGCWTPAGKAGSEGSCDFAKGLEHAGGARIADSVIIGGRGLPVVGRIAEAELAGRVHDTHRAADSTPMEGGGGRCRELWSVEAKSKPLVHPAEQGVLR